MVVRRRALPLAATLLLSLVAPIPAAAVTLKCVEREPAFARLKASRGEVPVQAGLAANGALLEVTANAAGEWTAFFSYPDGYSCPFASGEGWRGLPRTAPDVNDATSADDAPGA